MTIALHGNGDLNSKQRHTLRHFPSRACSNIQRSVRNIDFYTHIQSSTTYTHATTMFMYVVY